VHKENYKIVPVTNLNKYLHCGQVEQNNMYIIIIIIIITAIGLAVVLTLVQKKQIQINIRTQTQQYKNTVQKIQKQ
jgi:hypothetical protein